jgi:hypothetical protein
MPACFRRLGVIRLGAERIRLPVEFLHQKIEPPAHGFVSLNDVANLDEMTVETIEFLIDIQLLSDQRKLGLQPVGICLDIEFRNAVALLRTRRFEHIRHAGANGPGDRGDISAAGFEHFGNARTFAGPHRLDGIHCRCQQCLRLLEQGLGIDLVLLYDPRPAHDVERVYGACRRKLCGHFLDASANELDERSVDL